MLKTICLLILFVSSIYWLVLLYTLKPFYYNFYFPLFFLATKQAAGEAYIVWAVISVWHYAGISFPSSLCLVKIEWNMWEE